MENKFFRPAENLMDEENTENKFFMPAGDISAEKSDLLYPKTVASEATYFRNPGDMDGSYFKPAGDLTSGLESEGKFFMPAGDINKINDDKINNNEEIINKTNNNEEIINKTNNNIDKIKDYLLTIVNGKKDYVCELGVLDGAGEMVVSFERLMQMVEEGYNIVKAEVINANMILIEFQKYKHDEERVEGRKRF